MSPGASDRLGAPALGMILYGFSGVALSALLGIAFARTLEPSEFGEFAAARGMLGLLSIVASLGFTGLVLTALPTALAAGEPHRARSLLLFSPRAVVAAGLLLAVGMTALHWWLEDATILDVEHFGAVMALLPLAALQALWAAGASAMGGAVTANILSRVALPLLALGLLGIVRLVQGADLSVFDAVVVWGGALLVDCILTLRLLRRMTPPEVAAVTAETGRAHWLVAALPYLGSTVLLVWLDVGGIIVIGWIHAEEQAAAVFAAAAQLSALALVLGVSTSTLYQPRLAQAIAEGDTAGRRQVERQRNKVVVPLSLLAAAVLIIFRRQLLGLYGEEYEVGAAALIVLVLAKTMNTIFALAVPQLQYMRSPAALWILGICVLLSIPAMILLGEFHDAATGVAVGQAATLALASLSAQGALMYARRRSARKPEHTRN